MESDVCSCEVVEPDFYEVVWRKARKAHTCCECASPIDKGERYRFVTGMWELEWGSFRQCETCGKKWESSSKYYACLAYGRMWEYLGS